MNRNTHDIDFKILGDDMQLVEVELDPQETVIAEAGAMNYMDDGIAFEAKAGDGSREADGAISKLMNMGSRMIMGESIFITHFTNQSQAKKTVAFAGPYPGKIIAIDLSQIPSHSIYCQKQSFLTAAHGTRLSLAFNKKLGAGFFGGEGFIMEKIEGNGKVFVHAGGTVIEKDLRDSSILIDTGCIVAYSEGIDFSVKTAGGLKSMFLGGEGMFLAKLSGTGKIWLQSLPFSRLANRIYKEMPVSTRSTGEGNGINLKF